MSEDLVSETFPEIGVSCLHGLPYCRVNVFPNASSPCLLRGMEPLLAASILSTIDLAKHVSLTLDNVEAVARPEAGR